MLAKIFTDMGDKILANRLSVRVSQTFTPISGRDWRLLEILSVKLNALSKYCTLHRQTLLACLMAIRGVTVAGQADKCLVLVSNLLFAGLVTM